MRSASHERIRRRARDDFHAVYESGETVYLLDVRLPEEYETGHIPGSVSLPLGQMALAHENFLAVRAAPVFVVSDDDPRAVWAASLLRNLGFRNVAILDGGVREWANAGHALEEGVPEPAVFGLEEARDQATLIDAAALRAHIESSAPALDVRNIGEYGFAHIPGTRWLPRGPPGAGRRTDGAGQDPALGSGMRQRRPVHAGGRHPSATGLRRRPGAGGRDPFMGRAAEGCWRTGSRAPGFPPRTRRPTSATACGPAPWERPARTWNATCPGRSTW